MTAPRPRAPVDPVRSRNMAAVKGKNTQPELRVRRALHAAGLRFRLHAAGLPGRPDMILPARRLAVFVHGCFWHRHARCRFTATPATRKPFWLAKFAANVERDRRNRRGIRKAGWRALVIWECQTRDPRRLELLARNVKAIRSR